MKVFALVGFLAFLAYASADCGCLKCSRHLTVIGKTVPSVGCPSATVISRDRPSYAGSHSLPIRVQTPVSSGSVVGVVGSNDLTYKIVNGAPCGVNVKVSEPVGVKYDTRIEVPVPVPTAVSSTTVNLKPCVDRIVIPSHVGGHGIGLHHGHGGETVYVNPIRSGSVYVNPIREYEVDTPVYVNSIGSYGNAQVVYGSGHGGHGGHGGHIYVNTIKKSPVYVNSIRGHGYGGAEVLVNPVHSSPVYVNPIRTSTVCKSETVHVPSGPVLDCGVKKIISRYRKSVSPSLGGVTRVYNSSLGFVDKGRSKREVPFLKHGYKFMMNMLPQFIQDPIKNTVNVLALTHPDQRLQRVYNLPRKLSLKEKLQMQKEKNLVQLKNKLRQYRIRNNLMKKPYFNREPTVYIPGLEYPEYQRPYTFTSRSNIMEGDDRSDRYLHDSYMKTYLDRLKGNEKFDQHREIIREENPNDSLRNTNTELKNGRLTEMEKALLMRKLRKLSDSEKRIKRASTYNKYWLQKYREPPKSKRISNLLHSSDIVMPFYRIKEHESDEKYDFNYNCQDVNPWDRTLRSFPNKESQNFRYRRQGDTYKFLEPFSFKHVAAENRNIKEEFLRSVIREELRKNQIQQEQQNYVEPLLSERKSPQSPVFHVITFPIRLIKKFKDITKEAFPEVGSLPKLITGTKKYFKDFGRNFRKNVLHLTSDLIGDFENLDITNNILGPSRQRRSTRNIKKGKKLKKSLVKIRAQYEPDYSLVFGRKDDSIGKIRNKRYILKMVDEDEIESYLMEKLGGIFYDPETPTNIESSTNYPNNYPYFWSKQNEEEEMEKKYVLEQLKPKIILDNNGRPFLEINGYKRPVLKKPNKIKKNKLKTNVFSKKLKYYDSSEEVNSEKIASLIDHAKNHVENNLKSQHSEIPIKTIKEKISQLLFETDILVHMDFDRYDNVYDDLINLQQIKSSIVQDWKRLIMSKAINDIEAKITLLERFKELQNYKDLAVSGIVLSLSEDTENMFVVKKLIKMLVRLQKLQCIVNQVVSNFRDHLHISSKSEIEKEIKYVDFLSDLNFAVGKSRNDMISNLKKDRDTALQKNIIILDKLKKLLMYEIESGKVEEEAKLLWEMKNIEKMQKNTIEDLMHKMNAGYKIKKELKILFDLLKRYETCEMSQKKLLSKFEEESDETEEEVEEESSEEVGNKMDKNIKEIRKKKVNAEVLREKWQERLKKRRMVLKKKLKRKNKRLRKESEESDEDE